MGLLDMYEYDPDGNIIGTHPIFEPNPPVSRMINGAFVMDDDDDEYDSLTDDEMSHVNEYWKRCQHRWVDSGMPGGMRFCKDCDLDYDEVEALQRMDDEDMLEEII